jgi:ribosome-associated toxin RatA of RatAB toxin-antitoxin module
MTFLLRCCLVLVALAYHGFAAAQDLPYFSLTDSHIAELERGMLVSDVGKAPNGQIDVFGVVDITATPETIWAIMQDCTQQLDIIPDLKACNVLEQSEDKKWDKREQIMKLGFPLPNVRSEFRSDYTPFHSILITRTGGDLSVLNGEWLLDPITSNTTRISYRARMKSRLPVPRRFIRKGVERDMPLILRNLKNAAEAQGENGG